MKYKPRKKLHKDDNKNLLIGVEKWVGYWRENIEIFVEDYLGVHLYPFQKVLLHEMSKSNYTAFIATRGLGKSWLTAVFCCAMAILYPGILICVASGNKKQASMIITEKIQGLMHNSPNLTAEIKKNGIKTYHDNVAAEFKNGSKVFAVTSNHGSRG